MNIDNIFKSAFALAAFVLVSCTQVEVEMNEATGYLCAPSLDVDVTVEDLMGTKAVDFLVETPDYADVHFLVKDKDGVVKHDRKGLWEKMLMPVGKYSIKATCGSNGFGAPYFTAETAEDAAIEPYEDEKPALTLGLGNALMKVTVPSDFATHFTLGTVTFSASGFDPVVLTAAQIADWYYVPSEVAISVTIKGTSSAGVEKVFEYGNITLAQKSARTIVCGDKPGSMPSIALPDQTAGAWAGRLYVTPATFTNVSAANQAKVVYEVSESGNWDDIKTSMAIDGQDTPGLYHVVKGLENGKTYHVRARVGNLYSSQVEFTVKENLPQPIVTLEHSNKGNADVMLEGTNAGINLNLSGILATLHSEKLLQTSAILKKGSEIVRTSTVSEGLMEGETANWPYLPQGLDYALNVTYAISGEATFAVTSVSTVESPSPVFKVTLGQSWTSFDKGVGTNGFTKTAESVAEANALTGADVEALFDVTASCTIADALLNDSRYTPSTVFYLDEGTSIAQTFTNSQLAAQHNKIQGLSRTTHSLKSVISFDGVSVSSAVKNHHITGIPYTADPPVSASTDSFNGWTEDKGGSNAKIRWDIAGEVRIIAKNRHYSSIYYDGFYVPANESIRVYINNDCTKNGILGYKYSLSLGSTEIGSWSGSGVRVEVNCGGYSNMSNDNKKISAKVTYNYSHADSYYCSIRNVIVKYAEPGK